MNETKIYSQLDRIEAALERIEKSLAPQKPKFACHADGCIQSECSIDLDERENCLFAQSFHVKEHCPHWREP